MSGPRILKLSPNRDLRRLELIHRGYVEISSMFGSYLPYARMAQWGWLVKHEPVDLLDAYEGHRPTKAGLAYLHYDEAHHLILVRPSKVEEVTQRYYTATEVLSRHTMAAFEMEMRSATARGFKYDPEWHDLPGKEVALERLAARGFLLLTRFQERHRLTFEELIVSGVLRYLEHRDPDKIPNIDVGPKAKHCIMCSTRWQEFFVRPGMEVALLDLISIHEA